MKRAKLSLAILCIGCLTATAAEKPQPDEVLEYKQVGDVVLSANVFYPADHRPTDNRPVVAFFFGGGWTGGSPGQFYQQADFLRQQGMVAISFEYRVKKQHDTTPFECVKDGKSAIRWIRKNADTLGIDPDRVVSAGGSAGGHVAACTGVIEGHEESGEDLTVSSVPNIMVLSNPVIDTTEKGYGVEKVAGRETEISPCHHVRKGIVPTLIFHGTADTTVPLENQQRFTRLMTAAGNVCVLSVFEDANHGFFNPGRWEDKNGVSGFDRTMQETVEFLKHHKIL